MLTQIYSPYPGPINKPAGSQFIIPSKRQPLIPPVVDQDTLEQNATGQSPRFSDTSSNSNAQPDSQQSSGMTFATLSQSATQKIKMGAVLQDFKSTMSALGTSPDVQQEVDTYLNAVQMQAQKAQPSIPFIKQTLKTAADVLDGHITQTLGQPSKVVKDWVDALLMQPIDYKMTKPIVSEQAGSREKSQSGSQGNSAGILQNKGEEQQAGESRTGQQSPSSELSQSGSTDVVSDKTSLIKTTVSQAKQAMQQQDWTNAQTLLQGGLNQLDGQNRPDLEGRLYQLLGKTYDLALKPQQALQNYHQADAKYAEAGLLPKQGVVKYAIASINAEQGNFETAQNYYDQALNIGTSLGQTRMVGDILNDLGGLHLQNDSPDIAASYFQQALQQVAKPAGDKSMLPSVYHNLATAYQTQGNYKQAAVTYKTAMDYALHTGDQTGYLSSLQNLGQTYEAAGKTEKARQVQEKIQQLNAG